VSEPPLTVGEVVGRTAKYFASTGSPSPRLDADLMIGHALGLERIDVYTQYERPLTVAELDAARRVVARRGRREPVAYITGRRGFRRLDLEVTPAVLVPRPETELLVEWVVEIAPEGARVLDWGTGSGAIALAVADERPDLTVTGIDRSAEAVEIARANGTRLGLDVEWVVSDGFSALAGRRFDLIAANPPYLSEDDLAAAPAELRYEPRGALVAGPRGDEAIDRLAREAPAYLAPRGAIVMEVGEGQSARAVQRLTDAGFAETAVRHDLAAIARTVLGRLA
jgi:release factor glutamine methyltransferase